MSRLLSLSVMALGACCVLLLAGGFPLMGAEGVYSGGASMLLSLLVALLCLGGLWRLTAGARLRFLGGALCSFFSVAGLVAVGMFGRLAFSYARQGGPLWFGAVGMLCMGLVGLLFVLIFGFLAFRLMTRRLWLAGVHGSVVLVLAGAWMDGVGEQRAVLMIPADGTTEVSSVRTEKGEMVPLGFSLRMEDFQVSYYDTEQYTLYAYGENWAALGHPRREGERLHWGKESWAVDSLRNAPGVPQPFLVLPGDPPRLLMRDAPTVKDYRGECLLKTQHRGRAEERHETLRVNEPLSCEGWRLYLMNCRPSGAQMLVELQARRAPGRRLALTGMVGIILCTACWCWRKKEDSDHCSPS